MQRHQFLEAMTASQNDSNSLPSEQEAIVNGVSAERNPVKVFNDSDENMNADVEFRKQNNLTEAADLSGIDSNGIRLSTETVNLLCSTAAGNVARRVVHRTIWHCDRCPYATAKRSQLETHRHLHGSAQRHTCDKCDYSVSGVHLLLQHVRLHNNDKPAVATDTDGTKDQRHPKETTGQGETCTPIELPRSQPQQQHPKSVSPDIGSSVALPLTTSATVRTVYKCDKCPYSNARRDLLLCHARFHSGAGPLLCPHCDYSVSKVHLLTQHLRVHKLEVENAILNRSPPQSLKSALSAHLNQSGVSDASTSELCDSSLKEKTEFMRLLSLKLVY
jgi:hypothetical protein